MTRHHHNELLPPVRQSRPQPWLVPRPIHQGPDSGALCQWASGASYSHGLDQGQHGYLSALLPSAEAQEEERLLAGIQEAAPAHGCHSASDNRAGSDAAAGFAHQGADVHGFDDAWQQLLTQLRDPADPHEGEQAAPVVGAQPENRVLLPQEHSPSDSALGATRQRSAHASLWVVNPADWVDVEYVLRKMLRCESTDCHAFHSMGYVFFRSCAVSHVASPSEYLQSGMKYKFPDTEVAVEIVRAHPEGVLEVACFLEYCPDIFSGPLFE